jgi:adenine-specific DNA-methyltransferase
MAKKKAARRKKAVKQIKTLTHSGARRKNIPTAEHQSVLTADDTLTPPLKYPRNPDLDPQLVWRGKDGQDTTDLVVQTPPLYIQEKIYPKVLVDDLLQQTKEARAEEPGFQTDLFADFNGFPEGADPTEFYKHEQNWTNRMILGDALEVMASLSERESLRGKVQCIYLDPPYGIKFNSNFQWSTTSSDVKDGKVGHITREPEQVKAFRDTWRDGIHSYLTYLRDRLTVARDLLTDSGSIFVQIGDENVHLVRTLMDEIFGNKNCISEIIYKRGGFQTGRHVANVFDYLLWYAKSEESFRSIKLHPQLTKDSWYRVADKWREDQFGIRTKYEGNLKPSDKLHSDRACFSASGGDASRFHIMLDGVDFSPPVNRGWSTSVDGARRLTYANRLFRKGKNVRFKPYYLDFPYGHLSNNWVDTVRGGFSTDHADDKTYVVQTLTSVVQRCILLATQPGDLVLDPTCGSGTTAYVAEQWGRRWITIDTSRVALALARARIMGARYPYYLLADSRDGQQKEAEITKKAPSTQPVGNNIRHGFVYERVPHITLKSIANNAEIDVIWDQWQTTLEPLRKKLNTVLKKNWENWEIPREADDTWSNNIKKIHADWWQARIGRQQEIDASIAAKAEFEYLYDKPYIDNKKVRVAGPFTVESLSPHRVLGVDSDDNLIEPNTDDFVAMVLDNLKIAGVQQTGKKDRVTLTSLTPWPGDLICGDGRYQQGDTEQRAAIFVGPEFGTVQRADLVTVAQEAADAEFDVVIACAFNYEAHVTELNKLGRIPILKARMNADLHMAKDLKTTSQGNLFVIFGEPDIELLPEADNLLRVQVKGVDIFKPQTNEVVSHNTDGIACWFIDTNYNEESFFVRHAYFLGATKDPYKALKSTLKAEINEEAWATLHSDTSRPFPKPANGRIAVKVINHLGDEAMKVFQV